MTPKKKRIPIGYENFKEIIEKDFYYEEKISDWFNDVIKASNTTEVFNNLLAGNTDGLQTSVNRILKSTISYNNYAESFYHAFLAGILAGQDDFCVKSDWESGEGRPDLMIFNDVSGMDTGVIIEVKYAKESSQVKSKLQEAVDQINAHDYKAFLEDENCSSIIQYAMVFCKKRCWIKKLDS